MSMCGVVYNNLSCAGRVRLAFSISRFGSYTRYGCFVSTFMFMIGDGRHPALMSLDTQDTHIGHYAFLLGRPPTTIVAQGEGVMCTPCPMGGV